MKSFLLCLAFQLVAVGVEISLLGAPEFLDTEVSTARKAAAKRSREWCVAEIGEVALVEGMKHGVALIVR